MNKSLTLALLLIALSALAQFAFAQQTPVEQTASSSSFELVKDWRTLSFASAVVMVVIVAIAYMAGISMESPEIKAWASAELTQAFVTVVIIIAFSGVITLLDTITSNVISSSNLPFTCSGVQNCATFAATQYLQGMIESAEKQVNDRVMDSAKAGKWMSYRAGAYATQLLLPIPLLQASTSGSVSAGLIMDIDRNQTLLEHLGNLLSMMYSQYFFVDQICFKIGPIVLVLGVVARAFFVTRKLGGLLIAMGIAAIYVLPLMYVLNWITLNVTLFGDSTLLPQFGNCPAACLIRPPLFYSGSTPFYTQQDVYNYLQIDINTASQSTRDQIDALEAGAISQYTNPASGKTALSCEAASDKKSVPGYGQAYCPVECRELPYSMAQTCNNAFNFTKYDPLNGKIQPSEVTRYACSKVTDACKIIRYVTPADPYSVPADIDNQCPKKCRTVPPLKSDCVAAKSVPINYLDNSNDLQATSVTASCTKARDYCFFAPAEDLSKRPDGCTPLGTQYEASDIFINGDKSKGQIPDNIARNDSNALACPASKTATQSCVYVLPDESASGPIETDQCNNCLFVRQEYTFDPPVYRSCAELCNPGGIGPPKINPNEFAERTKEGMVGKPEIKSVAALMLPAYVLPILDILVTLMFVRSLSPILGGDIEIPGLARII